MQSDTASEITSVFPQDIIRTETAYGNQTRMDVNPENIILLCEFIAGQKSGELISLFAADERNVSGGFAVYYVFSIRSESCFIILKTLLEGQSFHSISNFVYSALLYEREIWDMFGLVPEGHPDLRNLVHHGNWPEGNYPLRKNFNVAQKLPFADRPIPFTKVKGTGVFEVPVGPVHAGIIEPGHFRFSVAGEPIINLEAQLSFVHKGIEKLCEGRTVEEVLFFSERISGDETFANSLAYCMAIEKIAQAKVPQRAEYARIIFAELERLLRHIGDLGGICVDVAYGFASSQFQLILNWTYQLIEQVCGSRFLRSVNKPGGLRRDFITGHENLIIESINRIESELIDTVAIIKAKNTFIDRVENTGVLSTKIAGDLHAVGPAARASGICADVRKDFPYGLYDQLDFAVPQHANGDVNCRMNVKIEECYASVSIIRQALARLPGGSVFSDITTLPPFVSALACVEAPRGEAVHWIMTGENSTILRYKIRTPSFCIWPALCQAVRGNIIPDFPLINKSFNLSYAGNDL